MTGIRGHSRSFAAKLMNWYAIEQRNLPWRLTQDPYRIWVSEIMLQQTRARAVIPYYRKFLERFPTIKELAEAPEAEVLLCWSGLGYYSRARNLQQAARQILEAGAFPDRYESIRQLPGVGAYTAAAVASIAFGLPHAVLDGNVMRVISRITNDPSDIGSPKTKARFQEIAQTVLDRKNPGRFNQAMMELGATICLPKAPRCLLCPISAFCQAHRSGTANQLPVKLRKPVPERIQATLVIVEREGEILLWRRKTDSARLAGFWELPAPGQLPGLKDLKILGEFRHCITNHNYTFRVASAIISRIPTGLNWIRKEQLHQIPLSTTTRKALRLAGDSFVKFFQDG